MNVQQYNDNVRPWAMFVLGIIFGIALFIFCFPRTEVTNFNIGSENFININGIYRSTGYYCVVTKGRTLSEIDQTEQHEICHALVDKNHEHFCKK